MMTEMDRASSFLRSWIIPEEKETDLIEQGTILANVLGIENEDMEGELDQVFRVNSSYARRNKIPHEVQVKFVKRMMKDKILKIFRDEPIVYGQTELVVLKQVSWRVREMRKQYHFLSNKLNENRKKLQVADTTVYFSQLGCKKI
ncbi:hypothetical protein JRQ81_017591 [Phrynocephalus forsythii]|uniref:Uncharacterized protein n=1 Tax=Phrynocephalus forsythii TaxID=171643 RepID=A0A9Q0XQN7_9SAUR|nr:hypothetical protein JRQ81_017591 [Phrynocephalus forsythii]